MSITDWPVEERPRERLLRQGAGTLSDAELPAIFLRVGIEGKNAVELVRDVLARFDHRLHRLAGASLANPTWIKGWTRRRNCWPVSNWRGGRLPRRSKNRIRFLA